jgi:hypothetical protein
VKAKVSLDEIDELYRLALYNRVQDALFEAMLGMPQSLEELNEIKAAVTRMVQRETCQDRSTDSLQKRNCRKRKPRRHGKRHGQSV